MKRGDKVVSTDTNFTGVVLIAEGNVVFAEIGPRVCRYVKVDGRWQRDYLEPESGRYGHDELRLLND
jgi:hypothetical protein